MNENTNTEKLKLLLLSHKNVCMSICDFTDIIKNKHIMKEASVWKDFELITDEDIIKNQHLFGKLGEANCYCSYIVAAGNARVSNLDNPNAKNENDWSAEMSLGE